MGRILDLLKAAGGGVSDKVSLAVFRTRFSKAVEELPEEWRKAVLDALAHYRPTANPRNLDISGRGSPKSPKEASNRDDDTPTYESRDPAYSFEFLVLHPSIRENVLSAIDLIFLEKAVFD